MKTASGVIALILGILGIFNVGGCIKTRDEYRSFLRYNNSSAGVVESVVRGFEGGSKGDPFGAVLGYVDQARALQSAVSNAQSSAWLCVIGTGVSLAVYVVSVSRPRYFTRTDSTWPEAKTPAPPARMSKHELSAANIEHVLNLCADIGQSANLEFADVPARSQYVSEHFQSINTSDCPEDFQIAFTAHADAWSQFHSAAVNKTIVAALIEGSVPSPKDHPAVFSAQAAQNSALEAVNHTYHRLTALGTAYGARIPYAVVKCEARR